MRETKKNSYVLILLLMGFLFTSCGNSAKSFTTKRKTYTKIVYAYTSFNTIPDDVSDIEEAINVITRKKIGVEVELRPLSIVNYTNQINLAMQGGEQLDIFHSLGNFSQYLSRNQAYDLTNIIDIYGKEAKEVIGDRFLTATTKGSSIYGIPANKAIALQPQLIYRKDSMDAIGIDPETITSVSDLNNVFSLVKDKFPNITPIAPANVGVSGLLFTILGIDYLTDDYFSPKGVLLGYNKKVVDFYSTDEFRNRISIARNWYNNGYISKDAATSSSTAIEQISAGTTFSFIANYGYTPEDTAIAITAQVGREMAAINLGKPFVDTTSVNAITWMVSSLSKHPEEALEFLNLTYYDRDVLNLIIYGLEGRDYVKVDDEVVKYPDGLDASTVPYTAQLSCGIVGNQFEQYVMEGTDPAALLIQQTMNRTAETSIAFGFMFDYNNVKNEYTAVSNVINQYLPGLQCGSLNPETESNKFTADLNDAGLNKIIEEKQKQLNLWLKSK